MSPSSLLDNHKWVVNLVETIPPAERRTLLDVGPGCGTFGVLVRGYVNDAPDRIDCVEIWPEYVRRFRLPGIYDHVYIGDVASDRWFLGGYEFYDSGLGRLNGPSIDADGIARALASDVVLMGDVIEHIEKQKALDLLARIPGRVVICTPVDDSPCSGEGYENPAEAHVSHWGEADWRAIGLTRPIEAAFVKNSGWLVRVGRLPT